MQISVLCWLQQASADHTTACIVHSSQNTSLLHRLNSQTCSSQTGAYAASISSLCSSICCKLVSCITKTSLHMQAERAPSASLLSEHERPAAHQPVPAPMQPPSPPQAKSVAVGRGAAADEAVQEQEAVKAPVPAVAPSSGPFEKVGHRNFAKIENFTLGSHCNSQSASWTAVTCELAI